MAEQSKPERAAPPHHAGWRRGGTSIPPAELVRVLREAAQHRARRAVRLYGSEDGFDQLDAAADAGSAVELLAKACIAVIEPAAIAKVGGAAGIGYVLRLRGHGYRLASPDEDRLSTIEASLALSVAAKLYPQLSTAAAGATAALEARNDSLHMGLAHPDRVLNAIAAMAALARKSLPILGVSREDFWGEPKDADVADQAVVDRSDHIAEVVDEKLNHARTRYEQVVLRIGETDAKTLAAELERRSYREDALSSIVRCPSCGNFGRLENDADFEAEPDGEGGYDYIQTSQWVAGFSCPVCQLDLDGDEALEAGLGGEDELERDE